MTFSSSVRYVASMITLLSAPASWHASLTLRMSSRTTSCIPLLSAPTLITMSISRAPSRMTLRVSKAFISAGVAPNGNPTTLATRTFVPRSRSAHRRTQNGFTQTLAKPNCLASSHSWSMSSMVASGLSSVWSMYFARSVGTFAPSPW